MLIISILKALSFSSSSASPTPKLITESNSPSNFPIPNFPNPSPSLSAFDQGLQLVWACGGTCQDYSRDLGDSANFPTRLSVEIKRKSLRTTIGEQHMALRIAPLQPSAPQCWKMQ
ncbi:hypothetical protein Droror1_Dr00014462 [Drosera rotundifolia]